MALMHIACVYLGIGLSNDGIELVWVNLVLSALVLVLAPFVKR